MNKLLGELEIELGEKKYVLKPTFQGLTVMEDLSGKSLSELVGVFLRSRAGIKDVAAVIYGGMYGANGNKAGALKFDEIGELAMQAGAVNFFGPCGMLVGCAYAGKPIDEALKAREEAKLGAKADEQEKKVETQGPQSLT